MALLELKTFSPALQKQHCLNVIHPDRGVPGPYHVMLLLHGLSDDHSIWLRQTNIERYVEGLPLLVVMPDGGRGFYCDAVQGYGYFTAIAHELPELIRHLFHPEGNWCTTGLSMGGYGALRIALGRPDLFESAYSLSGAVLFGRDYPALDGRDEAFSQEMIRITGPVDAPGGKDDLLHLAQTARHLPKIKFDCGDKDFLLEQNRAFHAGLEESRIPHEYVEHPGDHNWPYWDEHVRDALVFHRKNLGF